MERDEEQAIAAQFERLDSIIVEDLTEMWGGRMPTWEEFRSSHSRGIVRVNRHLAYKSFYGNAAVRKACAPRFGFGFAVPVGGALAIFAIPILACFVLKLSYWFVPLGWLVISPLFYKLLEREACRGLETGAARNENLYETLVRQGAFLFPRQEQGDGAVARKMTGAEEKVAAFIIGTGHEYQRHQDKIPEREQMRAEFEGFVRSLIEKRGISLIAEEAGCDVEVWKALKKDEEQIPPELRALFAGTETVSQPVSTIAKHIAHERHGTIAYVDMRAPHAEKMTIEQRDQAMAAKITQALQHHQSVLVICGEKHRIALSAALAAIGVAVESRCFP